MNIDNTDQLEVGEKRNNCYALLFCKGGGVGENWANCTLVWVSLLTIANLVAYIDAHGSV